MCDETKNPMKITYGVVVLGNNLFADYEAFKYLMTRLTIPGYRGDELEDAFQTYRDHFKASFGLSIERCALIFKDLKRTRSSIDWFIEVDE